MICAYSKCGKEFTPKSPNRNQKYCSYECSVKANNQRAMDKYNERKKLLQDPKRKCATPGCGTILRRTNVGKYCDPCQEQHRANEKEAFRNMVLGK